MIINEARFAAAYRTQDGTVKRFDDPGCLFIHNEKYNEQVSSYWVRDYEQQKWIEATDGYFVQSDSLITPMGYGIVAVANKSRAQEISKNYSGKVLKFRELLNSWKPKIQD